MRVPLTASPIRKGSTRLAAISGLSARVDQPDAAIPQEVGPVAAPVRLADGGEQPAQVGVPEALRRSENARSAAVGGVRVTVFVGEVVVLAMVGHPLDHRSLHSKRSAHGERVAHSGVGLEGAVGEQPVKPDRDAKAGDGVPHCEKGEVHRLDEAVPEQHSGKHDRERRQHQRDQIDDSLSGHQGPGLIREQKDLEGDVGLGMDAAAVPEHPTAESALGNAEDIVIHPVVKHLRGKHCPSPRQAAVKDGDDVLPVMQALRLGRRTTVVTAEHAHHGVGELGQPITRDLVGGRQSAVVGDMPTRITLLPMRSRARMWRCLLPVGGRSLQFAGRSGQCQQPVDLAGAAHDHEAPAVGPGAGGGVGYHAHAARADEAQGP